MSHATIMMQPCHLQLLVPTPQRCWLLSLSCAAMPVMHHPPFLRSVRYEEGAHLPWTVGIGWGLCHIILRRLRGVHVITVAREAGDVEEGRE